MLESRSGLTKKFSPNPNLAIIEGLLTGLQAKKKEEEAKEKAKAEFGLKLFNAFQTAQYRKGLTDIQQQRVNVEKQKFGLEEKRFGLEEKKSGREERETVVKEQAEERLKGEQQWKEYTDRVNIRRNERMDAYDRQLKAAQAANQLSLVEDRSNRFLFDTGGFETRAEYEEHIERAKSIIRREEDKAKVQVDYECDKLLEEYRQLRLDIRQNKELAVKIQLHDDDIEYNMTALLYHGILSKELKSMEGSGATSRSAKINIYATALKDFQDYLEKYYSFEAPMRMEEGIKTEIRRRANDLQRLHAQILADPTIDSRDKSVLPPPPPDFEEAQIGKWYTPFWKKGTELRAMPSGTGTAKPVGTPSAAAPSVRNAKAYAKLKEWANDLIASGTRMDVVLASINSSADLNDEEKDLLISEIINATRTKR